ncbi:MAG: preprotein translocase subunit SecY [Chloroflexi bacterium]|nr:preprotein translocase subunit SecY [Chloroflexota bacterium]
MLQAMVDAFRLTDLRNKLLFTLAMLVVFRFVAHVPVPGVNTEAVKVLFESTPLLGFMDLFSGGAMRNVSVAAMGVYPYITASIIMQLLVPVIPRLQTLAKEGETGQNKINLYTHWLTVPLAMGQAYGQLVFLQSRPVTVGGIESRVISGIGLSGPNLLPTIAMVISMTAGTMFLVWLGERITENGIGNGISIIIFGGIVTGLPSLLGNFLAPGNLSGLIYFIFFGLVIIFGIVIFQEAQRRVPVQYSRGMFRGGRMYRAAGSTYIPLRVNMAGMIPLIFAISIMIFPGTLASYFLTASNSFIRGASTFVYDLFNTTGIFYWVIYFFLVVGFTFFYTMVIFQQQNMGETLQRQGGFIPGIRPGKPTGQFLNQVTLRITWAGALFLGVVAIMPYIAAKVTNNPSLQVSISSTSLLIMVGVVLDTMRQLESQLLMRRYEGFLR